MNGWHPAPPVGFSHVPPGHIASVVTCLEMSVRPADTDSPGREDAVAPSGVSLAPFRGPLDDYRALFRSVGERWLWFSRLVMPDDELEDILADAAIEVLVLSRGKEAIGLLELDFRVQGECELSFLGLVESEIGHGLGSFLMSEAIQRAWARPIRRFWVHTCSLDHPAALGFYVRSGFRVYARGLEVAPDPRILGHLPRSAAPQIPLIES